MLAHAHFMTVDEKNKQTEKRVVFKLNTSTVKMCDVHFLTDMRCEILLLTEIIVL